MKTMKPDKRLTASRVLLRATMPAWERYAAACRRHLGARLEIAALARGMNIAQVSEAAQIPVSRVLAVFEGDDVPVFDLIAVGCVLNLRLNIEMKKQGGPT